MEELFKSVAGRIALGVEVIAALVIAYGAAEAAVAILVRRARPGGLHPFSDKKAVWQRFGVWLLLGLEFELAADIVRSAIAPTWEQIGQLAAIAAIRTFLNYFLEKDVEKSAERAGGEEAPAASRRVTLGAD